MDKTQQVKRMTYVMTRLVDYMSKKLPDDVENPIIFKFSTDMIPILLLSVQAEESQPALYKILDDNVANPLARVPGVGTRLFEMASPAGEAVTEGD